MNKIFKILLLAMMCTGALYAQEKRLTLEELMGNKSSELRVADVRLQWWGNTLLEMSSSEVLLKEEGKTLFTMDQLQEWAGNDVKVNSARLTFPYEREALVRVEESGKRNMLVDFNAHKVVWSQPVPSGAAHQDWNPVSRNLAYTIQGNLYVQTAEGGTLQVSMDGSTDGSQNIVYGTSVHRDEFGISKGTFWSPDGQKLAFYRMDQSMVPSYPQVDIYQRIAGTYTDHYPMAGETSHQVKVGIYDVAARKVTYLDLYGEKEDYHTNISWAPDGKTVYVFELDRAQRHMRLFAYDVQTGARGATPIIEEKHPCYVEPFHPLVFLPWDSSCALLQTRADGWNQLYLLNLEKDKDGVWSSVPGGGEMCQRKELTQLTKGEFEVQELLGFNTKTRSVLYRANEGNPLQSLLYSISLKGNKRLLTVADGVHEGMLSASGTVLIDRYSSPTVPRSVNVVQTSNGKSRNLLTAADPWKEQGYEIPEITSGDIKAADGTTTLYYRMVKPVGFDPTKKYPAVIYVYGGPHAHNVDAHWHWNLRAWEAHMAGRGYLVFILDNRGSQNRGLAFEQATYGRLGQVEMADQMEGVRFLKTLPYVDADRMGVHGWSFGGFMTTTLMCTHPEVFKVGVAGGPVIDWKFYEVMYGERYMRTPQANPEGYAESSLLGKAGNLKGRLQLIIGYNDPTCVPQHTLSFLDACMKAGTQPDLFVYPGEGHNMSWPYRVHLHERITRYFDDYLK